MVTKTQVCPCLNLIGGQFRLMFTEFEQRSVRLIPIEPPISRERSSSSLETFLPQLRKGSSEAGGLTHGEDGEGPWFRFQCPRSIPHCRQSRTMGRGNATRTAEDIERPLPSSPQTFFLGGLLALAVLALYVRKARSYSLWRWLS